jgi:hypothetical protein
MPVTDQGNSRAEFDSEGNFMTKWDLKVVTKDNLLIPWHSLDTSGNVYVVDAGIAAFKCLPS